MDKSGKHRRELPRLAVFGIAFAVALALVFAIVPQDFDTFERVVLAMFTALTTLFFGPYVFVAGLTGGFLGDSVSWRWLVAMIPLYLAHIAFLSVIFRRTTQWRRFGKYAEVARRSVVALMAVVSAAAIWFELPQIGKYEVVCDAAKLGNREIRLAVVTDLHSCIYGESQSGLIKAVSDAKPDALLLVGDIFDDRFSDANARTFISHFIPLMPCIYVTGNHEYWSDHLDEKLRWLWKAGVITLAGDCKTINLNGVDFCGVDDPTCIYDGGWLEELDRAYSQSDPSHLRILLSHRPEYDWAFGERDFDLVVSGHLHGGQWRIPLANIGVFGPEGNRFFPKFTCGMYSLPNGSRLALSRGLAREAVPLPRFFNHPELMVIVLQSHNLTIPCRPGY